MGTCRELQAGIKQILNDFNLAVPCLEHGQHVIDIRQMLEAARVAGRAEALQEAIEETRTIQLAFQAEFSANDLGVLGEAMKELRAKLEALKGK